MPVKPLKQQHYKSVKSIFHEAFGHDYTSEDIGYAWRKRLSSSKGYFNRTGDLLGFAITINRHYKKPNYLYFFGVYDTYKGMGYGTKILREVIKSEPNVYLWPEGKTDSDTAALKSWYRKHGFRHSSDNYYAIHSYGTRSKANVNTQRLNLLPLTS
jgi:ribosomal protein S18 acetylase RimI-like enzyme